MSSTVQHTVAATDLQQDHSRGDPRRWLALPVLLVGAFLPVLDFNLVNLALPAIRLDLGATSSEVQFVISAYAASYAVFLITGGRLGDLFGRRRMFLLGVAGFTVASVLCGDARSPAVLVAGRILQGLTATVMAPQVLASIRVLFPSAEQGRALGLYGATFGLANICGQVLGGVLVSTHPFGLPWQAIFFINVPIGLAAFIGKRQDEELQAFVLRHAHDNERLNYFRSAYPVEQLENISPDATVAICGLGLTAHDVICKLTVGRGGRFHADGGKLRYERSGREPRLLVYSRKCLPFSCRAINQKGPGGRYVARFFTPEAIAALRASAQRRRGSAQIDFVAEVLPLVMRDMAYARHMAQTDAPLPPERFELGPEERGAIEQILDPLRGRSFDSLADFRDFFREFLIEDLAQAELGNMRSPVKAAADVLRDLRDNFRLAAEYGGFTPESHARFVEDFVNVLNRIVFGPPRHRNAELLCLLDSGVVDLAGGPGASTWGDSGRAQFVIESAFGTQVVRRLADVLIASRIDVFSPLDDDSPLMRNLLRRELIRPYRNGGYHPGGIDIDRDNHVINGEGVREPRMWAVGYLVEGPHYYTQELPRPGRLSRLTLDAQQCVNGLFDALDRVQVTAA